MATNQRTLEKPTPGHQRRRVGSQRGITLLKKTEAKVRDCFRCLVPGCGVQGRDRVEAAHLVDSGMGGRFSVSSQRGHFATVCREHHQGVKSIHTTHLLVMPTSAVGADGPLAWYRRERTGNVWGPYEWIGESRPIPVFTRT